MEDNENKVEETTETNDEELEETEAEEVEEETNEEDEDDSDVPSLEDYEALQKKLKTIEAQKEHWRKKATSKPLEKKEDIKKTNNQDYLTRDEAILLTKGYDEDDLQNLKRIAGDRNLVEATKDPLFVAYKRDKEQKEKQNKAQLGASGKLTRGQKPVGEMTEAEHKALFYKSVK